MSNRKPAPDGAGIDRSQPLFPPQRAFVVQFSAETDGVHDRYVGRIEHVVSGHATRFSSSDELLKIIAAELRKLAGHVGATLSEPQEESDGAIDVQK